MNKVKELLGDESYIGYFGGELNPDYAKGITRLVIQGIYQQKRSRGIF